MDKCCNIFAASKFRKDRLVATLDRLWTVMYREGEELSECSANSFIVISLSLQSKEGVSIKPKRSKMPGLASDIVRDIVSFDNYR